MEAIEMKTYNLHIDASHGWLAVPTWELTDLGIENNISKYSYQSDCIAYLEQDCDLAKFIKAKGETPAIKEVYDGKVSAIRDFERFSKPPYLDLTTGKRAAEIPNGPFQI